MTPIVVDRELKSWWGRGGIGHCFLLLRLGCVLGLVVFFRVFGGGARLDANYSPEVGSLNVVSLSNSEHQRFRRRRLGVYEYASGGPCAGRPLLRHCTVSDKIRGSDVTWCFYPSGSAGRRNVAPDQFNHRLLAWIVLLDSSWCTTTLVTRTVISTIRRSTGGHGHAWLLCVSLIEMRLCSSSSVVLCADPLGSSKPNVFSQETENRLDQLCFCL